MKGRKPKISLEVSTQTTKCPAAPAWMTKDAKAEWKRTAPQVHGRGHLTDDTRATLEAYCIAAGTVRETEEIMIREGRVIETKDGPKRHPAFSMQSSAMREARLLAAELGLTPHRRGKPDTDDGGKGDGWDEELLA